jgi:VanZ family protein
MGPSSPPGRGWRSIAVLAGLGLVVHLWGLYRVTGPPSPPWFPNADKLEHLVGFGLPLLLVLLTLWLRARSRGRALPGRVVAVVVAAFALHGVVSELVQHFFYSGRTGDPFDTVADWAGVLLGLLAFRLVVGTARRPVPAGTGAR